MGEHVADETAIAAEVDTVWQIIVDLPRYPEWTEGIISTEVLSTDDRGYPHHGRFVIDARIAEFTYTLAYRYDDDRRVRWRLVDGDVISQLDGSYELTPVDGGTRVRYALEVDVDVPVPGFVKERAAKSILEQGLSGLRARAEAVG